MKLINLIIVLFNISLNLVYYAVTSPVWIPFEIYKGIKNRRWRKNVAVGDKCFFINMLDKKSWGVVEKVTDADGKKSVGFARRDFRSSSYQTLDVKELRIMG